MQKGTLKVIADAERHRRTPWTLAVESKAIKGMKSADIGGTGEEENQKRSPMPKETWPWNGEFRNLQVEQKGCQNESQGTLKNIPEQDRKRVKKFGPRTFKVRNRLHSNKERRNYEKGGPML